MNNIRNRIERYKRIIHSVYSYKRKKTVLNYPPYILWVEPTNHCNLECVMCPTVNTPKDRKGYMELGLFKKIIDDVHKYVFDINLFLGGESLLHKDIAAMISYATDRGIKVCLHTNATMLTKKTAEDVLDAGLDMISISFDGYEKEVYESIRVKANFNKTLNNIISFLNEKKRRGSKKPYTVFQIIEFNDPETKSPEGVKQAFYNQFKGLPLDRFSFITPHNFGGRIKDDDRKRFRVKSNTYAPCTFLWYSMSILWDGRVVPCCTDFTGEYVLGDIKNESLMSMWNGKKLVELRTKIIEKRYKEVNLCKGCDILFRPKIFGIPTRSLKGIWSLVAGNK